MIILAIETSCDDTCVAIVKVKSQKSGYPPSGCKSFDILSNIVSSQVKLHAKYGGVWPYLAKRKHQKNLPVVFEKARKEAKIKKLDLISVTGGPGLEPCLWVGVNFAKDLAKNLNLPIIPVNHIEAHIIANWLSPIRSKSKIKNQKSKIIFPAICLVVSGGHTQLILMKDFLKYKILGETRDDAAGECFDKVARILGLGYPGGPIVASVAATKIKNQKSKIKIKLPRPMIYQKNYDFSFAGLKTAVLYQYQKSKIKNQKYKQAICVEVQQAIIDVLIYKTLKAAKNFKAKSIILGGGVTANEELRNQFKKIIKKQLPNILYFIPNTSLCTDNAAMVAVAGYFHWLKGEREKPENIEANANLRLE